MATYLNMNEGVKMAQGTEVRFASFFSGGFVTAIVVNPPERKLSKRIFVQPGAEGIKNQNIKKLV